MTVPIGPIAKKVTGAIIRKTATEKTETDKMVAPVKTNQEDKIILASPLQGEILPLEKVQDPVFASGALGKGVAIEPTEGKLYAPADGEITTLFPTGHAEIILSS